MSLQQIAAVTKISARVLGALERNDVSKLPGGIFSRSFVRAYAREIGLDPEAAVERFIAEFPEEAGRDQMSSSNEAGDIEAFESRRRAAATALQLVVLSVVVIVVIMFAVNSRACRQPAAEADATQRAATAATEGVRPQLAAPPPADPVPAPPRDAAGTEPLPAGQTVEGRGSAAAAAAAPIQIAIVAEAECWLQVKLDKIVVLDRVLRPGERVSYDAFSSVDLIAGNAGGLSLTLNGKPARPLGASGAVVTATITADTLATFLR